MSISAAGLDSHNIDPTHDAEEPESEKKIAGRSPTQLAMARFRKDKLSMVAFCAVALYLLIAIASPFLVKLGVLDPTTNHGNLLHQSGPLVTLPKGSFGGISVHHWLGVDPGNGRDVLSRLLLGTSLSLSIAMSAALVTMLIGVVLGIVSGFSGGWVDRWVGRLIDLTLSFPSTLMLLALSGILVGAIQRSLHIEQNPANWIFVVFVLSIFGWPPIARIIRGQVLSLREREFVDAARMMGGSRARIYFKEILPNLWAPMLIYFTLLMPTYVSAEAALSYLTVGVKPPTPTLGNVLNDSIRYLYPDPIFFFVPAIVIALIVVSFNLVGDGLRDALDPKGDR